MTLLTKINSKSAHIGVIGLGYVGLPLVIEFCRAGFHVTGFDVDEQKIALLRQGKSYIHHIDSAILAEISGLDSSSESGDMTKESGDMTRIRLLAMTNGAFFKGVIFHLQCNVK